MQSCLQFIFVPGRKKNQRNPVVDGYRFTKGRSRNTYYKCTLLQVYPLQGWMQSNTYYKCTLFKDGCRARNTYYKCTLFKDGCNTYYKCTLFKGGCRATPTTSVPSSRMDAEPATPTTSVPSSRMDAEQHLLQCKCTLFKDGCRARNTYYK